MKRGTPDHPKARALGAALGLLRWQVAGLLETLWHFAAGYARRGDVGRHTDQEIADHLEWKGDATALVDALAATRWLDRCACHRVRIHDWPQHADQTVQRTEEVKKLGFLPCYDARTQAQPEPKLAEEPSFFDVAEKASQPSPSPSPSPTKTPPTPLRGEPAVESGEVTPIDAGNLVKVLASEFIDAGGRADRAWRRTVKHELQARGLDEGARVVRAQIAGLRASSAAAAAEARAAAVVSNLVTAARTSGRDGRQEWAAVVAQLEASLDPHLFGMWIRPLDVVGLTCDDEGDRLIVAAPSHDCATWIGRNYQEAISSAVDAAGLRLSVLVLVVPDVAKAG
jgi:hypothetical protein